MERKLLAMRGEQVAKFGRDFLKNGGLFYEGLIC